MAVLSEPDPKKEEKCLKYGRYVNLQQITAL
jgi:hypothetical protein